MPGVHHSMACALGVLVLCAGCGERPEPDRPAPRPRAEARPDIQGTWRMVRNPRAATRSSVATWRLRSACPAPGACFTVRSSTGRSYRFTLDPARARYTSTIRFPARCTPRVGRGDAPSPNLTIATVTILRVVAVDGQGPRPLATEMAGESIARLLPPGRARTCRERAVQQYDIRGVRTERPATPRPQSPESAPPARRREPTPPRDGQPTPSPLERLLDRLPGAG